MMNRLFIALDIPQKNLEDIIKIRDEIYGFDENIQWESADKLHITLKFLGDVGENMTELISNQLDNIQFNKLNTSLTKFGIFYKNHDPKILWVGLKLDKDIFNFKEIIEENCELLGFPKESTKFKPHLTLLRIKGKEDFSKIKNFLSYNFNEVNFTIDSFSLLKSTLQPQGSMYSLVKKYNLI